MYSLNFHEEAVKEFDEAYTWYGLQQPGLEERFRLAVQEILEHLQNNPQYFGYRHKPFREAAIKIFPYHIVFKIDKPNSSIYVSAIYHTSRNPKRKYRKNL